MNSRTRRRTIAPLHRPAEHLTTLKREIEGSVMPEGSRCRKVADSKQGLAAELPMHIAAERTYHSTILTLLEESLCECRARFPLPRLFPFVTNSIHINCTVFIRRSQALRPRKNIKRKSQDLNFMCTRLIFTKPKASTSLPTPTLISSSTFSQTAECSCTRPHPACGQSLPGIQCQPCPEAPSGR